MSGMRLEGKTVALLIADGYHEHEYWFPYYRFREEGANVITAAIQKGEVRGEGNNQGTDGLRANAETAVSELVAEKIDYLFLPGGLVGPLTLRHDRNVQKLVRDFMQSGKPVCAICHAPWILVSAGVLKGRKVTCPGDMSPDVIGAGAEYMDQPVVLDGNLLTAEYFGYLPEMFRAFFEAFA